MFLSLKPTRGLIRSFERDISRIPVTELPMLRRRIGIVFQDFRLLDHLIISREGDFSFLRAGLLR